MRLEFRRQLAAWATIFCVLGASLPGMAQSTPPAQPGEQAAEPAAASPPSGQSRITGNISRTGSKGGVAGARVSAYHLASGQTYTSEPSNAKGDFRMENLPHGYYDLAVETPEGLYVGSQVVNVPPDGKAILRFALTDSAVAGGQPAREFPGATSAAAGDARIEEKLTGKEFWRSPKGVAILASLGGAVLLAIAAGGSDDDQPVTVIDP